MLNRANSILPANGYFPNLTGIPSSLPKHHPGRGGACLYGWQHPLQLQDQLQAKLDLRCVASGRSPGRPHRPRLTQQSPRGTCSIHSWNLRSVIFVKKNSPCFEQIRISIDIYLYLKKTSRDACLFGHIWHKNVERYWLDLKF